MKEEIERIVYNFFINSNDFNGIPLRQISEELNIEYKTSIDYIKELVNEEKLSIQSSTNPHIISRSHYLIDSQILLLEDAKKVEVEYEDFAGIKIAIEKTEYPFCIYPSQKKLKLIRNLEYFEYSYYSKQLAIGEPQLKPFFFDIEVLERYCNDPRFDFDFKDYSGSISCKYDELYNPLVRNEDNIFIKTFGIGFDKNGNRVAVVFLRYLHQLTGEHQIYWKNMENKGECQILEEYYQNTIEGRWSFSHSIFSAFLEELKCLNELSKINFNIQLFNQTFENEKRPREFTFFFTPTIKNYHDFIHLLDKMITDNLNKSFFNDKVELFEIKEENGIFIKENKGTLRLLEEWLSSKFNFHGEGSISEIIKPFKKVRKERQTPAHKINVNTFDYNLIKKQRETISAVYNSMKQLRNIFSLHPNAKNYEIPNWLDNGKIINI